LILAYNLWFAHFSWVVSDFSSAYYR